MRHNVLDCSKVNSRQMARALESSVEHP
jgi:hypothetical protein